MISKAFIIFGLPEQRLTSGTEQCSSDDDVERAHGAYCYTCHYVNNETDSDHRGEEQARSCVRRGQSSEHQNAKRRVC